MRVIRMNEVPGEPFISDLFTSEDVTRQSLIPESQEYEIHNVRFGRGVRLKLHTHSSEQILIVTSGKGLVATEKDQWSVAPGDIIFIPKGEKHWHGAVPGELFSHIYIYRKGTKYSQFEK